MWFRDVVCKGIASREGIDDIFSDDGFRNAGNAVGGVVWDGKSGDIVGIVIFSAFGGVDSGGVGDNGLDGDRGVKGTARIRENAVFRLIRVASAKCWVFDEFRGT